MIGTLTRQGYRSHACDLRTRTVVCELLLRNRSPRLADLTDEALVRLQEILTECLGDRPKA
ncbi:hypothetical protein [Microvirga zambiensis]|uniref:hypothetical protein n=1 Tax=Microvirga zambiensis TaxID=1402137 RepID=UPI00191F1E93|nr:hypothetical protein [Microvirga zambiensis]